MGALSVMGVYTLLCKVTYYNLKQEALANATLNQTLVSVEVTP